jgi:uncharacterized protein (TIGR02611 family)
MRIKHHARRGFIALIGSIVIAGGIILIPLPGPGLLIVIVGLAILATEFVWAENLLNTTKKHIAQKSQRLRNKSRAKHVDKHHQ